METWKILKRSFKGIVAVLAALSLLYAVFLFVIFIKEPLFMPPLVDDKGEVILRNDEYGDGFFGAKRKGGRKHIGIDIYGEVGAPVYASKSGWARARRFDGGYGNVIEIHHPDGYQTRYAHLDEFSISRSQWVFQGQKIGTVGKSGNANYEGMIPHLHYEIRRGNIAHNPMRHIVRDSEQDKL